MSLTALHGGMLQSFEIKSWGVGSSLMMLKLTLCRMFKLKIA